jgi:hypothetical protein
MAVRVWRCSGDGPPSGSRTRTAGQDHRRRRRVPGGREARRRRRRPRPRAGVGAAALPADSDGDRRRSARRDDRVPAAGRSRAPVARAPGRRPGRRARRILMWTFIRFLRIVALVFFVGGRADARRRCEPGGSRARGRHAPGRGPLRRRQHGRADGSDRHGAAMASRFSLGSSPTLQAKLALLALVLVSSWSVCTSCSRAGAVVLDARGVAADRMARRRADIRLNRQRAALVSTIAVWADEHRVGVGRGHVWCLPMPR